jgi:hypothetical protein
MSEKNATQKPAQKPAPQGGKREQPTQRSPKHPAFDLEQAIKKAQAFYERDSFHYVPASVALQHWGYSPKSSSGIRALAALLHFGLLEYEKEGAGDSRRVRLSELGTKIVTASEHSDEYVEAVRLAALNPKLYAELWKKWGPNLPSDESLEYQLVRGGWDFNRDSVRGFIRDFKSTVRFAKLSEGDKLADVGGDVGEDGVDEEDQDRESDKGRDTSQETPPPPRREHAMADIGRSDVAPLDLVIPLIDGGQAILRIPRRMSAEDYEHLTGYLRDSLTRLRRALTRDSVPSPAESPAEPNASGALSA